MKMMKKAIAYILIAAALLPCFSLMAGAKNVCKEISGKTDEDGGVNTVFYVTTSDTDEHYVKMKMTKGILRGEDGENLAVFWCFGQEYIYDYYEIIVYGKQNGTYKQISKANVRDKGSYKIYFEGYRDYKIKIYSWKVQTINDEAMYMKRWVRSQAQNVFWYKIPTWKISKTSGVSLCR